MLKISFYDLQSTPPCSFRARSRWS
jgi:hypothetical protein